MNLIKHFYAQAKNTVLKWRYRKKMFRSSTHLVMVESLYHINDVTEYV